MRIQRLQRRIEAARNALQSGMITIETADGTEHLPPAAPVAVLLAMIRCDQDGTPITGEERAYLEVLSRAEPARGVTRGEIAEVVRCEAADYLKEGD